MDISISRSSLNALSFQGFCQGTALDPTALIFAYSECSRVNALTCQGSRLGTALKALSFQGFCLSMTLKDCILDVMSLLCNNLVTLLIRAPDKRGYWG